MTRLGIRGTLALGLAGLLAVAGAVAASLVLQLVSHEAEQAVTAQQRQRALLLAEVLESRCSRPDVCLRQLSRLKSALSRNSEDVLRLNLVGPGPAPLPGGALERADRDGVVADALQTRAMAWAYDSQGDPPTLRVAAPLKLPSGLRGVLNATFSLEPLRAAIASQQRWVLWSLLADFAGVLLFGIYLSGRHIVGPIRALTDAAVLITEAGAHPDLELPRQGPSEIARLSAAFEAMVRRLGAQQAELRGQLQALEAARADLVRSEKLATVGRLASGVAHEVGNPLAAVIGYVDFLRDPRGVDEQTRADLLARMSGELARIQHTIRDLLDFSRPSEGRPEVVTVSEVVRSALELVKYQSRFKSITVHLESSSAPNAEVDPARLRQVLVNLMLNAADAVSGEGAITVTTHGARRAGAAGVQVDVMDDGPGVPPEVAEQLFEPFFTTKPRGSGTGLGLAISQRLVEEAGGQLWLSAGSPGATFSVWLPAA